VRLRQRTQEAGDGRPGAGDRLVAAGAVIFGVGLLATLVTIVPLFLGSDRLPTVFYLAALFAPLGVAVALVGVALLARSQPR
jgi:hypothetical protein